MNINTLSIFKHEFTKIQAHISAENDLGAKGRSFCSFRPKNHQKYYTNGAENSAQTYHYQSSS
jgi:hypothetical protein